MTQRALILICTCLALLTGSLWIVSFWHDIVYRRGASLNAVTVIASDGIFRTIVLNASEPVYFEFSDNAQPMKQVNVYRAKNDEPFTSPFIVASRQMLKGMAARHFDYRSVQMASKSAPLGSVNGFVARLPGWWAPLLFGVYPLLAIGLGFYRRRNRLKVGNCLHCGYSLTGNTSGVCPECGTPVNSVTDTSVP